MVGFTLMMAAYSLRTWRRNGVACDELLFLPDSAHAVAYGFDSPSASVRGNTNGTSPLPTVSETATLPVPNNVVTTHINHKPVNHSHSEGDIAAGGPHPDALELRRRTRSGEDFATDATGAEMNTNGGTSPNNNSSKRGISMEEMRQHGAGNHPNQPQSQDQQHHVLGDVELVATNNKNVQNRVLRSDSCDSSLGWGSEEEDADVINGDSSDNAHHDTVNSPQSDEQEGDETRGFLSGTGNLLCRTSSQVPGEEGHPSSGPNRSDTDPNHDNHHGFAETFQENHPNITRFGSFFFFRNNTSSSTQNAAYAPSGPAVVGAALDLSMPVIFNFHLFIEAYNHIKPKDADSETPAKILPIIFLSVLIVRSLVPPGRRGRFWSTLKFTVMSPFHRVKFRDAFIGDIITSMVRPGQDILFALSYYVTVIWGTISGHYGLSESGQILEGSWVLHNVILPSCALLPLWWKFLQTLRQAYDEEKRWPHLGNAFKYLSATLVILYGMTHPENRRSPWWIVAFLGSILYQIWWDVIMDWGLLEIPPQSFSSTLDSLSPENWLTNVVSRRPDSHILLILQKYIFTPLGEGWRRAKARIYSLQHLKLRSRRLYKSDAFYWRIVIFNAVMRFTWMLSFIPAYRLSSSGEEKVTTFSSDVDNSFLGVVLPVAEIVRRMFWGILLLERKTIQMTDDDAVYSRLNSNADGAYDEGSLGDVHDKDDDADQLSGGDHSQTAKSNYQGLYLPTWLNAQQQMQHDASSSSLFSISAHERFRSITAYFENRDELMHNLFLGELGLWAATFVGLGCWAAS